MKQYLQINLEFVMGGRYVYSHTSALILVIQWFMEDNIRKGGLYGGRNSY